MLEIIPKICLQLLYDAENVVLFVLFLAVAYRLHRLSRATEQLSAYLHRRVASLVRTCVLLGLACLLDAIGHGTAAVQSQSHFRPSQKPSGFGLLL